MEEGWREVAGEGKGGEGGRERMREWREKYFSKVNNVVVLYRAFANVLTFEIFFFSIVESGGQGKIKKS